MRFIISETAWQYIERLRYRGAIGLFYETTFQGLFAYIIALIFAVLALIGLVTVIKKLFGRKKKESGYEKWEKEYYGKKK